MLFVQISIQIFLILTNFRNFMSKPIMVTIEDELINKIHLIQKKFENEYGETLNFSIVLNEILQKGFCEN